VNGNGTFTTYTYDADGEILFVVNRAPGDTVNSSFTYTYNNLGLCTTEGTIDGTWIYSYDAAGQLTQAVFAPNGTGPDGLTAQNFQYSYDTGGNRTQTIINGVTTTYTVNARNEYTQVGGTTYGYDANGNLITETNASGTTTFAFNPNNQLVGIQAPGSSNTNYQYNAFGNLYQTTQGGIQTESLFDPLGSNLIGQFTTTGSTLAHYTYGLGLVSQVNAAGAQYYYNFDALGSTAGLTNPTGNYADSYSYLPFGGSLSSNVSVSNPFQYVGQSGVNTICQGVDLMGSRIDLTSIGRFTTPDPLGIIGSGTNLYTYTANDPIAFTDTSGLFRFDQLGLGIAQTVGGAVITIGAAALVLGTDGLAVVPGYVAGVEGVYGIGAGVGNIVNSFQNQEATIAGGPFEAIGSALGETGGKLGQVADLATGLIAAPYTVLGQAVGDISGAAGLGQTLGQTAAELATELIPPSPPYSSLIAIPAETPPTDSATPGTFSGDKEITTDMWRADGQRSSEEEQTEDANGDVISSEASGSTYNSNGGESGDGGISPDGGTNATIGNVNPDGSVSDISSYSSDSNGNDTGSTITDYSYVGDPILVSAVTSVYDPTGMLTDTITYEYNVNGTVASISDQTVRGNSTLTTYTYNANMTVASSLATTTNPAGLVVSTTNATFAFASGSVATSATETIDDGNGNLQGSLTVIGTSIAVGQGIAYTGPVASFTGSDGTTNNYAATINWGDDTTSSGTIAANGSGGFNVTGTHTYPAIGSYPVSVNVSDATDMTSLSMVTPAVVVPSLSQSSVSVSPSSIAVGSFCTVTLTTHDASGTQEPVGGLTVAFAVAGGSAAGTFGPVTDNGDGTYTATFTGTLPGNDTVDATIDGQAVSATAPVVTVTPGTLNLIATAGSGQVALVWNTTTAAPNYNIYRGTTSGGESATAIASAVTGTSYTDQTLNNGVAYYYTVAAFANGSQVASSNEASSAPLALPVAPSSLVATAGNGQIALSWAASSGATNYYIYRATSAGGEGTTPYAIGVTGTTFTQLTLSNGSSYYYRVTAVNAGGQSGPSAEAFANVSTVTTASAPAAVTFSTSSQAIGLGATVKHGGTGVNEGVVTFTLLSRGGQTIGIPVQAEVANGNASTSVVLPANTPSGTYTVQASYADTLYASSSDASQSLAVSAPAAGLLSTTTQASTATAMFETIRQSVTLNATIDCGGSGVNEGTVTFQLKSGGTGIGSAVTSATIQGGQANVSYTLPANTAAGTYTIEAQYNGGPDCSASSNNGSQSLTVTKAATITTDGSVTPVTFSTSLQPVTLSATVTSSAGLVSEGTLTFTLLNGSTVIGTPVTSNTVQSGNASVTYSLPAGTAAASYTVNAVYNPGPDYTTSNDSGSQSLAVNKASQNLVFTVNSPVTYGVAPLTLSASGGGLGNPVTFSVISGPGTLNGNSLTVTGVGSIVVEADQAGNTDYAAATPVQQTMVVLPAGTTTTVTSNPTISYSPSSQTFTVSAQVGSSAGTPSGGTVVFDIANGTVGADVSATVDNNGQASTTFTLNAGAALQTYTITVRYSGSGNFTGSSSSATGNGTLTVTPAPVSLSGSTFAVSAAKVPGGGTATLTLTAVDAYGNAETGTLTIGFNLSAGSPGGSFGPFTNLGNGIYTETFSPTAAGTDTIVATINGQQLTSAPPTITVPVGPIGTIASVSPTFTWPAVANAAHYILKVTDTTTRKVVLTLSNLSAALYTLTPAQALTPGHGYTWSAQAVSTTGQTTVVSSNVAFSIAPLASPTPVSPSGIIATDMPTLTWTAGTDSTHTAAGHFTIKVTDTKTHKVLTIRNVTGTSYTLSTVQALTPGHNYTWSVSAVSSNGQATVASSTSGSFAIAALAAPVANSPAGTVTTTMPTFTWTPLINAFNTAPASYTIKVTDKTTGKVIKIAKLTGTSYTLTPAQALKLGHRYSWSVTAVSTNGQVAVTGPSVEFTIGP